MKPLLVLLAGLGLAAGAARAENFEGRVTMRFTVEAKTPTDLLYSVRDGRARIDTEVQGMSAGIIMDRPKGEMMILMNSQKMYLVRSLPPPPEKPAGETPGGGAAAALEKTAVTEKILGYDTTRYVTKHDDTVTEAWLTDQLGPFLGLGAAAATGRRGAFGPSWDQTLLGTNAFPLRVIVTKDGKPSVRLEATKVEAQKLPADLFTPPADFQKIDLGQMMRGLAPAATPPPN